jgi:hypothetical protein
MSRPEKHLCAGCDGEITDEFIPYDLPEGLPFSATEFYVFGKSQFCRLCISAIESADQVFEEFHK